MEMRKIMKKDSFKRLRTPRIVEVNDGIVRLTRRYNQGLCGHRQGYFGNGTRDR